MAVAVPIIMAAAGATTTQIIVTSLVLTAVGANDAINEAATDVFGQDLVNIGNVAGGLYLAFGGGFGGGFGGVSGAESAGSVVDATGGLETAAESVANAGAMGVDYSAMVDRAAAKPVAGFDGGGALGNVPASQPLTIESSSALGQVRPAVAASPASATTNPFTGAWDKAADLAGKAWDGFKNMDPKTQAALLQIGGGALSGWAQGKQIQDMERMKQDFEARYRSGSGLPYWARAPKYAGG